MFHSSKVKLNSALFYILVLGILILLTQQYESTLSQGYNRDEYPPKHEYVNGIYKHIFADLTAVPTDIPADAVGVDIGRNRITRLEVNAFSHLSQCTSLQMLYNQISEVEPGAFNGLTALRRLAISWNRLERLYVNMFLRLENCRSLSVQDNRISEIEPGSFNGLGNLEYLFLSNNPLNTLRADMFQGLVGLKQIWLTGIGLETISPSVFSGLPYLDFINLAGNQLTRLSADVFSHLPRPLTLGLHLGWLSIGPENPLRCDADLCWLKQEELQGTVSWYSIAPFFSFEPRCADGVDWNTWTCNTSGNALIFVLSILLCITRRIQMRKRTLSSPEITFP